MALSKWMPNYLSIVKFGTIVLGLIAIFALYATISPFASYDAVQYLLPLSQNALSDCPLYATRDFLEPLFTCKCNPGFNGTAEHCVDFNECSLEPPPCGDIACVNIPGSYYCSCPIGYYYDEGDSLDKSNKGTCLDINECLQIDGESCLPGTCVNIPGSYRCDCPIGYKYYNLRCFDVNECLASVDPCGNGTCGNTIGSYRCACYLGYIDVLGVCDDFNECEGYYCPTCSNVGICKNTIGSYTCFCNGGFYTNGSQCMDIDECAVEKPPVCSGRGSCWNVWSTFECLCEQGYIHPFKDEIVNGRQCEDIDECAAYEPKGCGGIGYCKNMDGERMCSCHRGYSYQWNKDLCMDIDECISPDFIAVIARKCAKATCINSVGSFRCECTDGWAPPTTGSSCIDVDECTGTPCGQGGSCSNRDGSYDCTCNAGYIESNGFCDDVDECDLQSPRRVDCPLHSTCENNKGGYECVCHDPYRKWIKPGFDRNKCYGRRLCPIMQCPNRYNCEDKVPGFIVMCVRIFTLDGADVWLSGMNQG